MEIPLEIGPLKSENLILKTATFLKGPQIFKDEVPLKRKKNIYLYKNNEGNELTIKIKYNYIDPIPKIQIDEQEYKLAPPLKWYEYTWIVLPLILIFIGGALGGAIGVVSAHYNARIFRKNISTISKYLFTGLISAASLFTYFIIALFILAAMGN